MQLTQEQQEAIRQRRVSVALSAGAGCGKTHVLTERFLSYLDPTATGGPAARLSELAAITFTERAAREMRVRIRRACRARLLTVDDEQNALHWLGLLRELDSARISTIHSFCSQLLRRHAVEAGLDPHFRVLTEPEAETLLLELLDDTLRSRLAQQQEPLLELLTSYSLQTVRDMVQELLDRRLHIDFHYWTQRTPQELASHWEKLYESWRSRYIQEFYQDPIVQTQFRLIGSVEPHSPKVRQRLSLVKKTLENLPHSTDPAADVKTLRENARVDKTSRAEWPSEQFYEEYKEAAKEFREGPLDQLDKFSHWPEPTEVELLARMALHVLGLADEVLRAYQEEKRRQAALDFNDLVAEAVRLLEGPYGQDIRGRLAAEIRHLLVDEFQDTDPMQVRLIERLCGDDFLRGKLFFVGDYKQSIYRFRGARPEEFHRLRSSLPAPGRLSLTENFRSQPGVLDFVNALFCEEFGPEYEPLRPHRKQMNPQPIVEFLWAKETAQQDSAEEGNEAEGDEEGAQENAAASEEAKAPDIRRHEAEWIARRIRQLLDSRTPLVRDEEAAKQGVDRLRPAQPGDIAILFRALSDVQIYEEALRQYEIPYYLVGGHAFYAQQEIYDLVHLLRAVQSPLDDAALVGVLRSPFFNLHDETLYWLARHPGGLWAGLCADDLPTTLEPTQRRRVQFAAATLQSLRADKDRLPIAELIQEALQRTGYDAALLAEFLGLRKLANLHKLIDLARTMDRTGLFTVADFTRQLSEFVAREPKEPLAATFPETSDVLRLMSIHQAKGLEFPIVIAADLDRKSGGFRENAAFHPEYGPMIPPPSEFNEDKKNPKVTFWDIYRYEEQMAELEESMRIFYVAATRAADYLILSTGWGKKTPQSPWMRLLDQRFDLETGQLKANLPEGYPAPEIRVVQTRPEFTGQTVSDRTRRYLEDLLQKTDQTLQEGGGRVPASIGPLPPDSEAPRRYSFSRLSGQLQLLAVGEETSDRRQEYLPEAGMGREEALDLGILIHAILAQMDYRSPEGVADAAARLAFRHLGRLSAEDAGRIQNQAVEMVQKFSHSKRANQIASAQKVYREVEFLLSWPPGQSEPTGDYVQGFLDCLYQDGEGRWHVVDFKTHQVKGRNLRQLAAPYELQMLLYGLAVQEIFGQPAAELVIYFLRPGTEYVFTWTEASRQRVIEQMNQAIRQMKESGRK